MSRDANINAPELCYKHNQKGFVLPLTLVLIAALAFLLTLTIEQTDGARARAAVFTSTSLDSFERHAVEQDIIFRALLELHGREYTDLDLDEFTYQGHPPSGEWLPNSAPFLWNGTYPDLETDSTESIRQRGQFIARVQDTSGLMDVNYIHEGYLTFLAEYMGLPSALQRRAVRDYAETIREMRWIGDGRTESVYGLYRVEQICEQPIWERSPLCEMPSSEIAFKLTARDGGLPNYRTMPDWLRKFFIPDYERLSDGRAIAEWNRFREENNMGGLFEAYGGERTQYIVAIAKPGDAYQSRFMLNVLYERQGRPYSIKGRVIEPRHEAMTLEDD